MTSNLSSNQQSSLRNLVIWISEKNMARKPFFYFQLTKHVNSLFSPTKQSPILNQEKHFLLLCLIKHSKQLCFFISQTLNNCFASLQAKHLSKTASLMPTVTPEDLWKLLDEQFAQENIQTLSLTGPRCKKETLVQKYSIRSVVIKKKCQLQWTLYDSQARQTHENFSWEQSCEKLKSLLGPVFGNAYLKTTEEEIQIHITKKEKIQLSQNKLKEPAATISTDHNTAKQYLFPEGTPCPFLVATGVMSSSGKVHQAKYRKFRQINRFAEFVYDLREHFPTDRPGQNC